MLTCLKRYAIVNLVGALGLAGCMGSQQHNSNAEDSSVKGIAVGPDAFAKELRAQYRACPSSAHAQRAERVCQRQALTKTLDKLIPLPAVPYPQMPVVSRKIFVPVVNAVNQRRQVATTACGNLGELAGDFAAECQALAAKKLTPAFLNMLYLLGDLKENYQEGVPQGRQAQLARFIETSLLTYAIKAYNNSPDLWDGAKDDIEITTWSSSKKHGLTYDKMTPYIKNYQDGYQFPVYLMSEEFLKKRAFNIYKYAEDLGYKQDCGLRSVGQALCLNPEPLYSKYANEVSTKGIHESEFSTLLNDLLQLENPFSMTFPFDSSNNGEFIPRTCGGRYGAVELLLGFGGPGTYISLVSEDRSHGGHAEVVIVTNDLHIYTQDFQDYIQYEGLPVIYKKAGFLDIALGKAIDSNPSYLFVKITNTPLPLDAKATRLVDNIDKFLKTVKHP